MQATNSYLGLHSFFILCIICHEKVIRQNFKQDFHGQTVFSAHLPLIFFLIQLSFVCLFDLILYIPVKKISVMLVRVFLGLTSSKQGLMYLAQGHNTATPLRFNPMALRSTVNRFTTVSNCLNLLNHLC